MNMKNLKVILSATVLMFIAPSVFAQVEPAETTAPAEMPEMAHAEGTMMTVHVKGMVCDFCARAVTKVFGKKDAVDGVHVDLDSGEIHVGLKPGMSLTDAEVETLVKKSGYALVSIMREAL